MEVLYLEVFSVGSYTILWWQLIAVVLVLIGLIWLASVVKTHTSLDFSTESDLMTRVLNDAWYKCGKDIEKLPSCVEDLCSTHFAPIEGQLYYQWHDGRKLRSIGPLNVENFSLLARVGEVMARGKV